MHERKGGGRWCKGTFILSTGIYVKVSIKLVRGFTRSITSGHAQTLIMLITGNSAHQWLLNKHIRITICHTVYRYTRNFQFVDFYWGRNFVVVPRLISSFIVSTPSTLYTSL